MYSIFVPFKGMTSDRNDLKSNLRHSSRNDPLELRPYLLLCLLLHPFIPLYLQLLQLASSTPKLYPNPYLSIHSAAL